MLITKNCLQRQGLADVPAFPNRLHGKLDKVDKRTNDDWLFVCRYIGKILLAVGLIFLAVVEEAKVVAMGPRIKEWKRQQTSAYLQMSSTALSFHPSGQLPFLYLNNQIASGN